MSLRLFQTAFSELLLFSKQQATIRWLVDLTGMPPLGYDEQAWLSEVWLPCARPLAFRHLALVMPTNLHNQLVIENVINDGRQYFATDVQFFSDTPSALDWLTGSEALILGLEREWEAAQPRQLQPPQQVA